MHRSDGAGSAATTKSVRAAEETEAESVALGEALGESVGEGDALGESVGEGEGVAEGVGLAVGLSEGLAEGLATGSNWHWEAIAGAESSTAAEAASCPPPNMARPPMPRQRASAGSREIR